MREMFLGTILPDLQRRAGQASVIRSRVLRTWGMSESGLAEVLEQRFNELDKVGNPTIAFQASGIDGIKVRVVAKCDDEATAKIILDSEEKLIRGILGDAVFGIDDESMEFVILKQLRETNRTVAAAESITGGILSSRMSALDPEMQTFLGSTIGPDIGGPEHAALPPDKRAAASAARVRKQYGSSVGLAVVAARTEEGEPFGTVYSAVSSGDGEQMDRAVMPQDRSRVREYAVINLLSFTRRMLK
jgi:nicotinamide-nucleotide amidase